MEENIIETGEVENIVNESLNNDSGESEEQISEYTENHETSTVYEVSDSEESLTINEELFSSEKSEQQNSDEHLLDAIRKMLQDSTLVSNEAPNRVHVAHSSSEVKYSVKSESDYKSSDQPAADVEEVGDEQQLIINPEIIKMLFKADEHSDSPYTVFDEMIAGLQGLVDNIMLHGTSTKEDLGRAIKNVFNHVIRERIKTLPFRLKNDDFNNDIAHFQLDPEEHNAYIYDEVILEIATKQMCGRLMQHVCLVDDTEEFREKIKNQQLLHVLPHFEKIFRDESWIKNDKIAVIEEISIIGIINWDEILEEIYLKSQKLGIIETEESPQSASEKEDTESQSKYDYENEKPKAEKINSYSKCQSLSSNHNEDEEEEYTEDSEESDDLEKIELEDLIENITEFMTKRYSFEYELSNEDRDLYEKIKTEVKQRYERDILGRPRISVFERRYSRYISLRFEYNLNNNANIIYVFNKATNKHVPVENIIVIEPLHLKKTSEIKHRHFIILNKYIAIFITALTYYNWLCEKEDDNECELLYNYEDLYEVYRYSGKAAEEIFPDYLEYIHGATKLIEEFTYAFNCYKQYKILYYELIDEVRSLYSKI